MSTVDEALNIAEKEMKQTPVKGTCDYLPNEMNIRDRMQQIILDTYKSCGYMHISTPILEDIENLNKSDGGDNLNLIFKIQKRGDKFESAIEQKDFDNLCDLGLRYDLTLPLSRFYANNKDKLLTPFKCIQMDKVYRAERPQKGRMREFVQCDIDILGSYDRICEIDLILTMSKTLKNLGLNNFSIRISDRQILKALLEKFGFVSQSFDTVCVTLDKLDKIGVEGVRNELATKNLPESAIQQVVEFFEKDITLERVENEIGQNSNCDNLKYIIDEVAKVDDVEIRFDPTLVRGQGYYTSTVFEIESKDYSCALGGGGRYDGLIGKFVGTPVPAVGFSIGFERIFSLLQNSSNFDSKPMLALIVDENCLSKGFNFAKDLRQNYIVSVLKAPNKVGKYLNKLKEAGFSFFVNLCQDDEIKPLN